MSIPSIQNSALNLLNSLVGWTDVYLVVKKTTGSPSLGFNVTEIEIPIQALVSKNESAYMKADVTNNMEFKICKLFKEDIESANTTYSTNIPTDYRKLKQNEEIKLKIIDGTYYQITNTSSGSYKDRSLIILEVERKA